MSEISSEKPSLAAAWEFYNTYTLPRRVLKEGTTDEFTKLEPGEHHVGSDVYGVWSTPVDEIGDFGLGIVLYFKMLLTLVGTILVCIGFSLTTMIHYNSDSFSKGQPTIVDWKLRWGAAVCDYTLPVCTKANGCACSVTMHSSGDAFTDVISGSGCEFKNLCELEWNNAYWDIAMVIFLFFGLMFLSRYQDAIVEEADEAEQTAQDYSILVDDPDPDATNPDEWQEFFSQFGHVTYVTVAINNGDLLRALCERRIIAQKIAFESATLSEQAHMFDPSENETAFDSLSNFKKNLVGAGLSTDLVCLRKEMVKIRETITALTKSDVEYVAVKVFVVFETETAQRACLKEMTVGTIPATLETSVTIPASMRFRGVNVLSITEAPEPTDIIWCNLETSLYHRIIEQSITFFVTCVLVSITGVAIFILSDTSPSLAGVFISVANGVLPAVIKLLNENEEHLTQGSRQSSLLLKLVLARWLTSGFIIWAIRGFENTVKEEFLAQVSAILFADMLTTPVIRLLDPGGNFSRYYQARGSNTQEKMNSYFGNTAWFLAERYTDMTKTLFVGLFFSCVYPGGLVFSMGAFLVCYWVDKYCLFRLWKQPPAIDASLTVASRLQIAVILVVHSCISGQFYAGFPFDSLGVTPAFTDMTLTVFTDSGDLLGTSSTVSTELYADVDQEPAGVFNIGTSAFMTDEQKDVVFYFSILNITLLVLVCFGYFGRTAAFSIHRLFFGQYIPVGDANPDLFSFVPGIQSYVPQHESDLLPFPLICCDMTLIDTEHISFTTDYEHCDVTKDPIMQVLKGEGVDIGRCFSVCKQYKSKALIEANDEAGKTSV